MTASAAPLKLRCSAKHYEWGKPASQSLVAALLNESSAELPYAELWIGAHKSGSATVDVQGEHVSLNKFISENSATVLGANTAQQFDLQLPFLFKVLSIDTALSIQAHPEKSFAKILHARDPNHYPDENYKPEIAIAISEVEMLYGFRPLEELRGFIEQAPELQALLPENLLQQLANNKKSLAEGEIAAELFRALIRTDNSRIEQACAALFQRLRNLQELSSEEKWILHLQDRFPNGDRGLFAFYYLNFVRLAPGEAIFTEPNVAHAYLYGDLVECMANSDNVVRAGLTSKFVDVETLLLMLDYRPREPELIKPHLTPLGFEHYDINCREFCVEVLRSNVQLESSTNDVVQILFCLSGSSVLKTRDQSYELNAGDTYLLPAALGSYQLECRSGSVFRVRVP